MLTIDASIEKFVASIQQDLDCRLDEDIAAAEVCAQVERVEVVYEAPKEVECMY